MTYFLFLCTSMSMTDTLFGNTLYCHVVGIAVVVAAAGFYCPSYQVVLHPDIPDTFEFIFSYLRFMVCSVSPELPIVVPFSG